MPYRDKELVYVYISTSDEWENAVNGILKIIFSLNIKQVTLTKNFKKDAAY